MTRRIWFKSLLTPLLSLAPLVAGPTNKTFTSLMVHLGPQEEFSGLRSVLLTIADNEIISKHYIYPLDTAEKIRKYNFNFYTKKYAGSELVIMEATKFQNIKGQLYAFIYLESGKTIKDKLV